MYITISLTKIMILVSDIVVGVISTKCRSIRNIQDDKCHQCFSVLDASDNDNIGHADIYFSQSYPRSFQLKLRERLINAFGKLVQLSEAYP